MQKRSWRTIHRLSGLLLTGLLVFYCLTGLLLNHRGRFDYFQVREKTTSRIRLVEPERLGAALAAYRQLIARTDAPTVIRVRANGVVEFLYGSHGKVTYVINPKSGVMERIEKRPRQPWHWLNRLHKAFAAGGLWLSLADLTGLGLLAVAGSGLVLCRYRRLEWWLLLLGLLALATGIATG